MSRLRKDRTYRVRQLQVSSSIAFGELSSIIASVSEDLGAAENVQVHSVGSSLSPFQNPPTAVATITFSKTPPALDNDENEWLFPASHLGWGRRNVIFDTHFLGFTVLNEPDPSSHALDCIAISGLGSHPFGSWKSRRPSSNFMWLRDGLPCDVPSMRNMIYGYDTTLADSESCQTVQDLAISFVSRLATTGRYSPSAKPVVFLAHSLGGVVLKHALLEMANSSQRRHIFESVRAVVFFGVPHKGMTISHLHSMVTSQPNRTLVEDLGPDSTYLRVLDDQFSGLACQSVRVFSVFETKVSPTVQKSADGSWHRNGPPEILVTRDSAIHKRSCSEDFVSVDRTHSDLVKFAEGDTDYMCVLKFLHDMVPATPQLSFLPQEEDQQQKLFSFIKDAESREVGRSELLATLQSEDIEARLSDIAPPHENTFEWVWTANELDFVPWLQSGTGIYWISGKPGSGKSTLMKYLYRNEQTEQQLRSTTFCGTLIRPSFFFHNRGSKNQKSLEGLLSSLLYQILSSEATMLDTVVDLFRKRLLKRRLRWSRQDLEQAFTVIMEQKNTEVSICLFLDALDEYDGDPESVAYFLRSIVATPQDSATKIKVCFSSRTYNIFIDEFGKCPGFKIHEHTQQDIEQVIAGRMFTSQSINDTLALGDVQAIHQFREVKCQLVSRAEGVFLWLKFALDNILRVHREGGTMADILQRLSFLPDELDQFYHLIIENVLPEHRRETYVMLETVLRYNGELTVQHLSGILACSSTKSLKDIPRELPYPPLANMAESHLARRLRSRCGGLLELEKRDESRSIVQFMHQTVKEFVSQPGFRQLVLPQERDLPLENGYSFLSIYGLCRLYHATDSVSGIDSYERFLDHTTEVELTTGRSQKKLIDEMPPSRFARAINFREKNFNSLMSFAVVRNLRLFISETLQTSGNQLVNQNPVRSLLHYAVDPETRRRAYHSDSQNLSDMVEILMRAGADTGSVYDDKTPFQELFDGLNSFRWTFVPSPRVEDLRKLMQYFLELGNQDRNEDIRFLGKIEALHTSSPALARSLLKYGADANARNGWGQTPLDIIVETFNLRFQKENYTQVEEAYETTTCLLAHGGRFTRTVAREGFRASRDGKRWLCTLERFIEVVEYAGFNSSPLKSELFRLQQEIREKRKQAS